jgi:hypothetical protein
MHKSRGIRLMQNLLITLRDLQGESQEVVMCFEHYTQWGKTSGTFPGYKDSDGDCEFCKPAVKNTITTLDVTYTRKQVNTAIEELNNFAAKHNLSKEAGGDLRAIQMRLIYAVDQIEHKLLS